MFLLCQKEIRNMNYLLAATRKVEKLYAELDKDIAVFQEKCGIYCVTGCNACCLKKDIEASVLEFLPLAYFLVETHQYDEFLERLSKHPEYCVCLSYLKIRNQLSGCTEYAYRGLICRLFGFSGSTDKYGDRRILTCKGIKETYKELYDASTERINRNLKIPMASDFQIRLNQIDPIMANDLNPINISIEKAINKVAYYYNNHPHHPRHIKNAG